MGAKPGKKADRKRAAATTTASPAASAAWLDSADPRRRRIGRVLFAAVWIYVGVLWLLALDQTFDWGVFGPRVTATR